MTERILFSHEKYFDVNEIYNKQNHTVYASSREEADQKGGIHRKTAHPIRVLVWLGACHRWPAEFSSSRIRNSVDLYVNTPE